MMKTIWMQIQTASGIVRACSVSGSQ
jgi:hypothetical protein